MNFLLERMRTFEGLSALAVAERTTPFAELLERYEAWSLQCESAGISAGHVVSIEGEYGPETIAAMLAVAARRAILVPLSADARSQHEMFRELAMTQWRVRLDLPRPCIEATPRSADHPLYGTLRERGTPGLVLFTSGSTGRSKAAVHDFGRLLEKFETPRQQLRTIVFLQLDHIGGINTLLYTLSNGGTVVVPDSRSPNDVCQAIERHRAQLLPASPTFLNLLMLSEAYRKFDISSLQLITYGTEPMPPSTLARLHEAFPHITLQQTYGLTELGILRSKSRTSDSLWVRVGGDGFETKVLDGRLWVKARSAMLGYLNAPSPFDEDGYFDTGDRVEQDGEWLRILGRESEIVNVGGNKVYPAEVESVLLEMEGVRDAAVRGEAHPLMGQIVTATVQLATAETPRDFRTRMRQFCRARLPGFAVPAQVRISEEALHNARFKRMRRESPNTEQPAPEVVKSDETRL